MILETLFLRPGQAYLGDRPALVSTVLGSCVSVTMFHPSRPGCICHALMPSKPESGEKDVFHYVDSSLAHMLGGLLSLRVPRAEIEVKLFGGSNTFSGKATVGQSNVTAALRFIEEERLRLCASDVGGRTGRKIVFNTGTGRVFLKRLGLIGAVA